ncbi:hypothetical protein V8F06_014801 [Rhypophila decipiens]
MRPSSKHGISQYRAASSAQDTQIKTTSRTDDQLEATCIIAQPADLVSVNLTTQPELSCNGDPAASVLQFHGSSFQIQDESLRTLQPGKWLNDEIINGVLRLIKEASNGKVEVIDSCALQSQQPCPRVDLHNAKVLLQMLIHGNHCVLGVYEDDIGLLVYESFWSPATKEDIWARGRKFFSEMLIKEDIDDLDITITSPLHQVNDNDCGVLSIFAAFHEATDLRIKPMCVDPHFWRDALYRLLRSQFRLDEVPMEIRLVELPRLPTKAQLSEHSEAVADIVEALFNSWRQHMRENNKRLASAKLVLEIARRAMGGATDDNLEDAVIRFQQVKNYCKAEADRLHEERRILWQLIGPCITNFPNRTVKTKHINKPGDMGSNLGKLNDSLNDRKRGQDGPSVDEPSHISGHSKCGRTGDDKGVLFTRGVYCRLGA